MAISDTEWGIHASKNAYALAYKCSGLDGVRSGFEYSCECWIPDGINFLCTATTVSLCEDNWAIGVQMNKPCWTAMFQPILLL